MSTSDKQTSRLRRAGRKAAGLCTKCGRQDSHGGTAMCLSCKAQVAEVKKRLYARRAAEKRCVDCGKHEPKEEKKVCEPCCLRRFDALREYVYGISAEEYYKQLEAQGGVCAVCKKSSNKRLALDHDHKTGKMRGLLCSNCNTGIGMFKDDPKILTAAAAYLRAHTC